MRTPTIYFIQSDCGRIKIGYTSTPVEKRLYDLQFMSPRPLKLLAQFPFEQRMETTLHGTFKAERLHGEWFEPSDRLMRFVKFVADGGDIARYQDPELGRGLFGRREA